MPNRSKKYIVLVVINIFVIIFFITRSQEPDDFVFNSNYVIELLDSNEAQKASIERLAQQQNQLQANITQIEQEMSQTYATLQQSQQQVQQCQNSQQALRELNEKQALARKQIQTEQEYLQQQCSDANVALEFSNEQRDELQTQLNQQSIVVQNLKQEIESLQNMIDKQSAETNALEQQNSALLETIQVLNNDLVAPVYLKTLYVTPQYCVQQGTSSGSCLEKVLLFPKFSKAPKGKVLVVFKDPAGRTIKQQDYDPLAGRVLVFDLSPRTLLPTGNYLFSFTVEDQVVTQTYRFEQPVPE